MTQCAAGADLVAVEKAIADHHALVYRLAYRLLGNSSDAEDVAQSVFLLLLRSLPAYERARCARSWLARMTVNKAISWVRAEDRRRRRELAWAASAPRPNPSTTPMNDEALTNALESLPDELRIPVILHYQEGFKYREIAAVCKCPAGTVAKRISTAKARLKAQLVKGGAVGVSMALEASLSAQPAVPTPPGLADRLVAGTAREASALNGLAAGVSVSLGKSFLCKLGMALGCASVLVSLGWYGISTTLDDARSVSPASESDVPLTSSLAGQGGLPTPGAPVVEPPLPGEALAAATAQAAAAVEDATPAGLEHHGPTVYGWVRDAAGEPLPGVNVALAPAADEGSIGAAVETDESGYYELSLESALSARSAASLWFLPQPSPTRQPFAAVEPSVAGVKQHLKVTAVSAGANLQAVARTRVLAELELLNAVSLETEALSRIEYYDFALARQTEVASQIADDGLIHLDGKMRSPPACGSCHAGEVAAAGSPSCAARDATLIVRASLGGFQPAFSAPVKLQSFAREQVDLVLQPARPIAGFVVDGRGHPAPGAEVKITAYSAESAVLAEMLSVTAGDDGAFAFESLPEGVYVLGVAPDVGSLAAETVARSGDAGVRLHRRPAGASRVAVYSQETGEPLPGYRVEAHDELGAAATATTDESGIALLGGLRPGRYVLNTFRDDSGSQYSRASTSVHVNAGSEAEARLTVGGRADIAGAVTGLGYESAPESWSVMIVPQGGVRRQSTERKHGAVGPDGAFAIKNIPAGEYWLVLFRRSEGAAGEILRTSSLVVPPAVDVVRAEIAAPPVERAVLEVVVVDGAGHPVAGATAGLSYDDLGQDAARGVTGGDGRAELSALPARYTITVTAPGRELRLVRGFEASAGFRNRVDVTLADRAPDAPLESYFASDPELSLCGPLSLSAYGDLLRHLGCADVRVSAELDRAGLPHRLLKAPARTGSAASLLQALLKSGDVHWSAAGRSIVLDRRD